MDRTEIQQHGFRSSGCGVALEMKSLIPLMLISMLSAAPANAAPGGPEEAGRWARPWDIPAESEFFRDRIEQPWNHFLLDGQQGFVSGREFYQATGEISPFLWPSHPFLRFGSDRA